MAYVPKPLSVVERAVVVGAAASVVRSLAREQQARVPADLVAAIKEVIVHVAPIGLRHLHQVALPEECNLSHVTVNLPGNLTSQPPWRNE